MNELPFAACARGCMKRRPFIPQGFSDGASTWCEFDLEALLPVRDIRQRTTPLALCRARRWNGAQPHQPGRCAARNGFHQLVEAGLDLLRALRGVRLRRSFVSVEEGERN